MGGGGVGGRQPELKTQDNELRVMSYELRVSCCAERSFSMVTENFGAETGQRDVIPDWLAPIISGTREPSKEDVQMNGMPG